MALKNIGGINEKRKTKHRSKTEVMYAKQYNKPSNKTMR